MVAIVQVLGAGVLSVASQSSPDGAEHDTGGGVQGRRCQAHREVSTDLYQVLGDGSPLL